MSLAIVRLLFDFGLVILIWMTQLVVYPSFSFYKRENLFDWHNKYTKRITIVVLPLMLGQLFLVAVQLWKIINWYTVASLLIVLLLWGLTFLFFVPVHNLIAKSQSDDLVLQKLVNRNWARTFLWTVLFVMSFLEMLE